MSEMKDGGPAFPRPISHDGNGPRAECFPSQDGMSLRDWFAGQAIAGVLGYGSGDIAQDWETANWDNCARYAYELADAMLAARLPKTEDKP